MNADSETQHDLVVIPATRRIQERRRQGFRAIGLFAIGAVAMTLVGCTPIDRLSVRYSDGQLEFATCHTVDANVMEVSVRSTVDRSVLERIWLVEGDIRVRPGDFFAMGEPVDGLAMTVDEALPSSASEVWFTVGNLDETGVFGDVRSARFLVADIREGEWTRSNGSRGVEPCERPN